MADQLTLFITPPPQAEAPPQLVAAPVAPTPRPTPLTAQSPLTTTILAWREHLAREGSSPHTVKAFGGDLNLLAHYLGEEKAVGQVSTADLERWLHWQRTAKQCSPKSYSRRVTSLKSFFRWLAQTKLLAYDPAAPVIQHSVLSPLPEILSEAEVEQARVTAEALRHAEKPDARSYVLFTLLMQTGIKKGECLALTPNDLDESEPDAPVLWVRYVDKRHRYKERKLKLDPAWVVAYRAYATEHDTSERMFPWSPRRLEYLLEDVSKAAGLTKRISFDMCRWTCAARDAKAGMDYDQIRQKLGLSKIQWREIGMKLKKLVEPGI